MYKKILSGLFLVLLMLNGTVLSAQTKKTLQTKKDKLLKDIEYTSTLLKKNQKSQQTSIDQLEKINQNIESRAELIKTMEAEIRLLDKDIDFNQEESERISEQIDVLRKSFGSMVYNAYKNRKPHVKWIYILSSSSLRQGYNRIIYFRQVTAGMKLQSGQITTAAEKLAATLLQLLTDKEVRKTNLSAQTLEASELQKDKTEKEKMVNELKLKEGDLLADIEKKKAETTQLTDKINAIVQEEIAKAEEEKKASGSKTGSGTSSGSSSKTGGSSSSKPSPASTTATDAASLAFAAKKGSMPWPVANGVITGKFGKQPHPVLDKIEIKNDGIDITTDSATAVKAVHEGEVSAVFYIEGYGNVVVIRHGVYLTAYSNLSSASVAKGDKVTAGQSIGVARTEESTGKTWINFQVREGETILNPASWID